jgi:hypothetical protein
MDWLKAHVFIAGWLSPTIALIGMLIRGSGKSGEEIDWTRMMLYIGFLTCLAAVFTPTIDDLARCFAGAIAALLAVYFMVQSDSDHEVMREVRKKKALGVGTTTPVEAQ